MKFAYPPLNFWVHPCLQVSYITDSQSCKQAAASLLRGNGSLQTMSQDPGMHTTIVRADIEQDGLSNSELVYYLYQLVWSGWRNNEIHNPNCEYLT